MNIFSKQAIQACPNCWAPGMIPCQDCAENLWVPVKPAPGANFSYVHRDDYNKSEGTDLLDQGRPPVTRTFYFDAWCIVVDENSGIETGSRLTNCRAMPSGTIIYGHDIKRVDNCLYWRLAPQSPH